MNKLFLKSHFPTLLLAVIVAVGILSSCSKDEPKQDNEDNIPVKDMLQLAQNKYWHKSGVSMVNKDGEELTLTEAYGRYGVFTYAGTNIPSGLYVSDNNIRKYTYRGLYYYDDIPFVTMTSDGHLINDNSESYLRILSAAPDKLVIAIDEDGWPEAGVDHNEGIIYQKGAYTKVVYEPASSWIQEQFENAESLY